VALASVAQDLELVVQVFNIVVQQLLHIQDGPVHHMLVVIVVF
jgi:hypothetical protein